MVEALSPEEDLGVRLAASDALKLAIDDFQFNTDEFSPFLEPAFSLLFALLKEVNECDTKVQIQLSVRELNALLNTYLINLIFVLDASTLCSFVHD